MNNEMILGRELIITTDLSKFNGVPCLEGVRGDGVISIYSPKIPTNIIIGKTYYYIDTNGHLVAFRIKAYSFVQAHPTEGKTMCLVETPNNTFWDDKIFSRPIFNSVEDYYTYLASGENRLEIKYTYFTNGNDNRNFFLKKTYYWHKQKQRPQVTETKLHFVLITEKNVYIGVDYTHSQYSKKEMGYASGEDCIKANIDGMKIIEFAEPSITFDLFIEEPKEPKVRILRFID